MPLEFPVEHLAPGISAEQQANLDCLNLSVPLGSAAYAPLEIKQSQQLRRVYLARLRESDERRDWMSLATLPLNVRYGWYMGLLNTCIVAAKRNLRVDQGSLGSISASVTLVDPGVSDFRIEVQDGPVGYRWVADCLRGCGKGMRYSQDISDTPISLFRLWDGDDLIYLVWAGGSAYRVRVWKVGVTGVAKLLEASSASRPEFLTMSGGEQAVRTRERSEGPEAGRSIVWTYRDGVFRGNSDPGH